MRRIRARTPVLPRSSAVGVGVLASAPLQGPTRAIPRALPSSTQALEGTVEIVEELQAADLHHFARVVLLEDYLRRDASGIAEVDSGQDLAIGISYDFQLHGSP